MPPVPHLPDIRCISSSLCSSRFHPRIQTTMNDDSIPLLSPHPSPQRSSGGRVSPRLENPGKPVHGLAGRCRHGRGSHGARRSWARTHLRRLLEGGKEGCGKHNGREQVDRCGCVPWFRGDVPIWGVMRRDRREKTGGCGRRGGEGGRFPAGRRRGRVEFTGRSLGRG